MVTKFIEPWVLYPGVLVLLLASAALLVGRLARRAARSRLPSDAVRLARGVSIALALTTLLLYAASTEVVAHALLGGLERAVPHAPATELARAEAIVVLGGGVVMRAPSERALASRLPADATLHPESLARVVHARRLAERLGVPVIVSGGTVFAAEGVPPEAEVARALLIELGLPPTVVRAEGRSRTTAENARFTAGLTAARRIALVTSAWHMRRAQLAFERAGLTVIAAPAPYTTDRRQIHPVMLLPSASSIDATARWLRESVGLVWYRISLGREG